MIQVRRDWTKGLRQTCLSSTFHQRLLKHGRRSLGDNECVLSTKLQKTLHQACSTLKETRRRVRRQHSFIHLFILQPLSERKQEKRQTDGRRERQKRPCHKQGVCRLGFISFHVYSGSSFICRLVKATYLVGLISVFEEENQKKKRK